MKIFLILSFLLLLGCTEDAPKVPKDIFYVLDKKVDKCFMYETPDDPEGDYKYLGQTAKEQCFDFSETESLYCIRPEFHMDLRKYGKDMKKWAKAHCK